MFITIFIGNTGLRYEKAIDYQLINLGIPKNSELSSRSDVVYVNEYIRSDGTVVSAHYRSKPEYQKADFSDLNKYNILKYGNEYYNGRKHNYPDAKELANIFITKPENAPESNEYTFIQPGYARILNKELNLTGKKVIPDNWSGIIYNEHSSLSKNASNSKELQNTIRSAYNQDVGGFKEDQIRAVFNEDPNLFLALKNVTILKPQIKDGYFQGILFDKYDFEWSNKLYPVRKQRTEHANNAFYIFQQISRGNNYYLFLPIKFKW